MKLKNKRRFITALVILVTLITGLVTGIVTTMARPNEVHIEVAEVEVVPVTVEQTEPVIEQEAETVVEQVVAPKVEQKEVSRGEVKRYTEEDLDILAKLIHCEAGVDNMEGKLAVATVVMNRTIHKNKILYGGPTIKGVILHKLKGAKAHQFSCVDNVRLWSESPGKDDYEAARKVLEGHRSIGPTFLYYYNPKLCKGTSSIKYSVQIGKHVFGEEK